MNRPERWRLGELLVSQHVITADQLSQALAGQRASGRKLGRMIIENGWADDIQIAQALARQLSVLFFDLAAYKPLPDVADLLSESQARRLRALPLEKTTTRVRVGMVDPTDLAAFDEIARLLKCDIDLAVVAESQFLGAVNRAYYRAEEISDLAKELGTELAGVHAEFGDQFGLNGFNGEDAPVVRLLDSMFEEALRVRASDIHIEPQERSLRIRYRIDGVLQVQAEADPKIATAVVLRLKLMAALDIAEKRLPQDGRFALTLRHGAVDVRISTIPTQHGESVVMRLLNQDGGLLSLDALDLPERVRRALQRTTARPSGMVLVTGPTGSGKTTTLYAVLNELNSSERKIITVEDPVEYRLPGLNQVQIQDKIDLSFDRVLRAALRQDPDVILIGEMRDRDTAEIGMRAALTGHLVLSTLHTNDAMSTPARLLDMGVPRYMVGLALQLVIAQRLVREVCKRCVAPHVPDLNERAWLTALATPAELATATLRHGRGCAECNQTGYTGRTGVYELLEMTPELVAALNNNEPAAFENAARRQMGDHTLARDALRLVLAGRATIKDAMRIGNPVDLA